MTDGYSAGVANQLVREGSAIHDAIYMEAVVAAYALMAHADGEVASSERRRLFALVRNTPAFEMFSRDAVAEEAAVHEANFELDPELAQQIAWEKLDLIAGQRRAVLVVVESCRDIIAADGVAHPAEFRMLSRIKSRLGLEELPAHA